MRIRQFFGLQHRVKFDLAYNHYPLYVHVVVAAISLKRTSHAGQAQSPLVTCTLPLASRPSSPTTRARIMVSSWPLPASVTPAFRRL